LRRLGRASNAADVVRELESLRPSLGPAYRLSELALPSLTALAEAHLRERSDLACDSLTGVLTAHAFAEGWRVHAQAAVREERELLAVAVTLIGAGDPRLDSRAADCVKLLAETCADAVAADDALGRLASATIAVLPRHGGVGVARIVAERLAESCRAAFAHTRGSFRIQIELRELTGGARERRVIAAGAQSYA
jgi:GGDEF domain-containing protein